MLKAKSKLQSSDPLRRLSCMGSRCDKFRNVCWGSCPYLNR